MTQLHEVLKPIICSPYEKPHQHYIVKPGEPTQLAPGRRSAMYYYRPPQRQTEGAPSDEVGTPISLDLVNELRERVKEWRNARPDPYPGVTRTTYELLQHWRRPDREGNHRLFFCQLEAAETIVFLTEARADMRQGLDITRDEPGEEGKKKGYTGFTRYACKMATGTGKTTLMAMLAAWSILNKVNNRSDGRFSDVVLILCPNITIRDRLEELDPHRGEQSLYRTRDLVPPYLMEALRRGKVIITNWHVLEPQQMDRVGDTSSRVVRRGIPRQVKVTRTVNGKKQEGIETHYFESDTALVERALGKRVGGKQNILVFNDEGHHAYRLKPQPKDEAEQGELWEAEREELERQAKEATVWVDGLDKIHNLRGINFCLDLSATPYYLNSTGNDPLRIVHQFLETCIEAKEGTDKRDIFRDPYFGWAVETLMAALQPDTGAGEAPEVPVYEAGRRESGSTADVDFWTSREVRDIAKSHLNVVVTDTKVWEQNAAYYLDNQENVVSFAKNSGLGFAIPYMHNGEHHEYMPDFLVRLQDNGLEVGTLILETKGYDPLSEVKAAAARRWVAAVNNDGRYGRWDYRIVYEPTKTAATVRDAVETLKRAFHARGTQS